MKAAAAAAKKYGDTARQHRVAVESTSSLFGVREGQRRDIENHDKVVYEKRREMLFFSLVSFA